MSIIRSGYFIIKKFQFFVNFGKKHISIPKNLQEIIPGRGHQSTKNKPFRKTLLKLFASQKKKGVGKRGDYTEKKTSKCSKQKKTSRC